MHAGVCEYVLGCGKTQPWLLDGVGCGATRMRYLLEEGYRGGREGRIQAVNNRGMHVYTVRSKEAWQAVNTGLKTWRFWQSRVLKKRYKW